MRFSGPWFTIGFCLAYAVVFTLSLPLFVYYPVPGRFAWTETAQHQGPTMHWYGLLASAALVGLVVGWIGRTDWLSPRLIGWSVLAPLVTILVVTWQLRVFFA